mmetsp:Transcript_36451/g.41590  ORF Transcript_36451/g.41590 Transcript_36451/m.41590 type:complete len:566 (+) Transcript_36451:46-1743(+)
MMIVTLLPLLLLVSLVSFINATYPTVTDQTQRVDGDPPSTQKLSRFLRTVHPSFVLCGGNSYCFKRTMDCVDEKCQCKDGLVFDEDRRHCNEIDECKFDDACTTDAFCVNHFAAQYGYKCECYTGFESILEVPDSTRMVDGIETGFLKGVPITLRPKFCAWGGEKNIVIEAIMNLGEFTDAALAKSIAVEYFKFLLEAAGVTLSLDKSSEVTREISEATRKSSEAARTFYPVVIGNSVDVSDSILEITFRVIFSSKVSERDIIHEDDIDMSLELPGGDLIAFNQSVVSGEGAAYIAEKINDVSKQVVRIQFDLPQEQQQQEEVPQEQQQQQVEVLYFIVENGMTLLSVPSSSPSLLPSITSSLSPSDTPSYVPSFVPSIQPSLTPTEILDPPTTTGPTTTPPFFKLTDEDKYITVDFSMIFDKDSGETLESCSELCKDTPGCAQFSWAIEGDCIGGTGSEMPFEDKVGFNTYKMLTVKPNPPEFSLEDFNFSIEPLLFKDVSDFHTMWECFALCKAHPFCKFFAWGSADVTSGPEYRLCVGGGSTALKVPATGFLLLVMNRQLPP